MQIDKDQEPAPSKQEPNKTENGKCTMAQMVQGQVNIARKAEQKHKKAQQDLKLCQQKWLKYQAQLKELYTQQQEAYLKDIDALENEVMKAQEASEMAELKLRSVLEKGEEQDDLNQPLDIHMANDSDP